LCAVGIKRHFAIPRGQAAAERPPSNRREGTARRDALAVLGSCALDPTCAVFIFENVVKSVVLKSGEPDSAAIAKATESFHRVAKVLDGQLKGKKIVTGDTRTDADFSLGAPMNLAEMARLPVGPYREIIRW